MMKFFRRSVYILVALYTLAGFFLVPYLIKTKVIEIANEKINGKLSIATASFNPYTFRVKLGSLELDSTEKKKIFSFRELNVNLQVLALLDKTIHVKSVELQEPFLDVVYAKDKKLNLLNIAKPSKDQNKTASKKDFRFILDDLAVTDGTIAYEDYTKTSPYKMALNDLEFKIKNIDTGKKSTKVGSSVLQFDFNNGGSFELVNSIKSISPFVVDGTLDLKSVTLYSGWKYIKDMLNIEIADGKLSTYVQYHVDLDELKNLKIDNSSVSLSGLRIKAKNKPSDILSIATLQVNKISALPLQQEVHVEAVTINGVDLKAQRLAGNKIDWQEYIKVNKTSDKPEAEDKNETKPWKVTLDKLALESSKIILNDTMLTPSQLIALENVSLHVSDLVLGKDGWLSYDFHTDLNHETALGASGKVQLKPLKQEGEFSITNLTSKFLNPYIAKYTAPIKADGALSLSGSESFSAAEATSKTSKPKFLLKNFDVNSSALALTDTNIKPNQTIKLNNFLLHVSDFDLDAKSWFKYDIRTHINQTGSISLAGKLQREPLRQEGEFAINTFGLKFLNPYINPYTYLSIEDGALSVNGKESFNSVSKSPKMNAKGNFGLEKIILKDSRDHTLITSFNKLDLGYTFDYAPNRLYIDKVLIDSLYANTMIDQNKTINFAKLMKPAKVDHNTSMASKQTAKKSEPFPIKIMDITVKNGSADFMDQSLFYVFKTHIHDLNGKIYGVSSQPNETSNIDLDGVVDQYGSAKIQGSINAANPKKYTDMNVNFSNLALNNLTAYSATFAGYKIDDGKLFVKLGYKINDGKLDAANSVVIKHIKLGETVKDPSITVWPLRLAVALLEDSDGVIDIDLPIKGDLNNPDFRYGAMVWKVLGNLVTKAVTAPFRLLGSMLGFNGDNLQSIDFEPGKTVLLPPEIEKLDNITKALQKRLSISLSVGVTYDTNTDKKAIQTQKLIDLIVKKSGATNEEERRNALNAEMLEGIFLKNSTRDNLNNIKNKFKEQYKDIKEFNEEYTAKLAVEDSSFMPVSEDELKTLAASRAKVISEYLVVKQKIDPTRIIFAPVQATQETTKEVKTKLDINVK